MVVDANLKRRISVVAFDGEAPQQGQGKVRSKLLPKDGGVGGKTSDMAGSDTGIGSTAWSGKRAVTGTGTGTGTSTGSGNESGNSDGSEIVSQSSEVRFRFQTLADRIKQFEYIQFADGPVTSFAFDRRKKIATTEKKDNASIARKPRQDTAETEISKTTSSSSVTPIRNESALRRNLMIEQPRQLGYNNVLHSNHRQRSRSLELPAQIMESIGFLNRLGKKANATNSPRGSSLDSTSRSLFRAGTTSTWAPIFGKNSGNPNRLNTTFILNINCCFCIQFPQK